MRIVIGLAPAPPYTHYQIGVGRGNFTSITKTSYPYQATEFPCYHELSLIRIHLLQQVFMLAKISQGLWPTLLAFNQEFDIVLTNLLIIFSTPHCIKIVPFICTSSCVYFPTFIQVQFHMPSSTARSCTS